MLFYVDEVRTFIGPEVDSEKHPIESWEWDFGDGSTGSGQIATHVYNEAGTYTVHLSTINNCGKLSNPEDPTCFQTITIGEAVPPTPPVPWWELHGTEVVAGVLMLGLGIGIPAILIAKKRRG